MSKKLKLKLKQGKVKIKFKSGGQVLPLGDDRIQQLLGAAMVSALAARSNFDLGGLLAEPREDLTETADFSDC